MELTIKEIIDNAIDEMQRAQEMIRDFQAECRDYLEINNTLTDIELLIEDMNNSIERLATIENTKETEQVILNPIQTKFGMIYVETLMHPRSEEERIKIYDSDSRYLDYFSVEELYDSACEMETTIEEEYAARLRAFREEDNFECLVHLLTTDYVQTTDNPFGLERELNTEVANGDCVNHIGKHYIVMKE